MSVFRILSTKSNTIASGLYRSYNSGQNACTDLWYGGGEVQSVRNSLSRHLIYFDLTDLQNKFNSSEIMSGNVTSYKLKMKNSIPSDDVLTNDFQYDRLYKNIATSFDLIAFPINKFWDQGRGYDLFSEEYIVRQKGNSVTTGYSNWDYATSVQNWDEPGVFTEPSTAVTFSLPTQHFDIGNEDMEIDITEIVNHWIVSGNTNFGIGIAYRNDYEQISGNTRYISSFLTSKTNSAFKPFIEVNYNQYIKDDRNQVSNNRLSRLFLYTFSGNNSSNFYSASTVTVKNQSNSVIASGIVPTKFAKGVYYFDILMSGATRGQKYTDIWSGITFVPGVDRQDYTQNFIITDNYYNSPVTINHYTLNTYGIENNQIINGNQVIRNFVIVRVDYSQRGPQPYFTLNYKMTMNNQTEIIPWTPVNMTIRNNCQEIYFDIDTSWLLNNQTYKIEFSILELGSTKITPESIVFRVIKPF